MTPEEAALIFAKAVGCGIVSRDKDGKVCTVLCDDSQFDDRARFGKCDCRVGATAIITELTANKG